MVDSMSESSECALASLPDDMISRARRASRAVSTVGSCEGAGGGLEGTGMGEPEEEEERDEEEVEGAPVRDEARAESNPECKGAEE